MDFYFDYSYAMDHEFGAAFGIMYLACYLIAFCFCIAAYVLSSLGLYTIAKRRGITNPWLAWIPVANAWIVGSISDQYRYVTKGQIRNKRKTLLILNCVLTVLCVALLVCIGVSFADMMGEAVMGNNDLAWGAVASIMMYTLVGSLGIAAVGIAALVVHHMAMYDLYTSVNPSCSVAFLVLGIIFWITEPFFIFFNRKKDGGMPPRCDIPVQPQPAAAEPWENVTGE